jgi:hypothetical protein
LALREILLTESFSFHIMENGPLSKEVRRNGFSEFYAFAVNVRNIPYGRPSDSTNFLSVLNENRGTCSSKHRLLAALAHECGHTEIELVVGIYEMSEENTPGVGSILVDASVVSIPEAHCYLRVADCRYDFTGLTGGVSSPFDALLSENVVLPLNLSEKKLALHQQAMIPWAAKHQLSFSQAWEVREACIDALTANRRRKKPRG